MTRYPAKSPLAAAPRNCDSPVTLGGEKGRAMTLGDGVQRVTGKGEKTLTQIEETQAALRESIEVAKDLADQSDRLIKKHRKEMEEGG